MKVHSKTTLFLNFALAALIGIAAGMPLGLHADDTEIYLGDSSLSTGVRPNVLFSLDTSGSMSDMDGGSSGLLYAINVLNGAAVYPNWDDVGDDFNLTKADRTYTLGGGIPSSAVPIFQEEGITLLIGGGGGATTIDPNLALPRQRTYWGQEE
jgi:hypothetical protein